MGAIQSGGHVSPNLFGQAFTQPSDSASQHECHSCGTNEDSFSLQLSGEGPSKLDQPTEVVSGGKAGVEIEEARQAQIIAQFASPNGNISNLA